MLESKANWKYTKQQDNTVQWMDDSIDLSPVIKELLLQRGITTEGAVSEFLAPDINKLHNPKELDSIDIATERVHKAIEKQEKILIYGDYDADGVSSTTVMLKTILELGADCDFYIPNRFTEGYGPNEEAFRQAFENGFRLIITVDTGIASVHEAEVAKQLGIDLIITDHHEPQESLPDAYAILHPKCSVNYPFRELAGVGVAFKFAESLLGYFPKHLLEFAAIGTIADLVPLVNENRILAFYGLHALSISNNQGIKALKRICKIEGNVTEEDVGFLIGPRINAVGRLQNAELAVELLMTDDEMEAAEIADEINRLNEERKQIVSGIVKEAEKMVQTGEKSGVIIVAKEGWNEGVLGIVASRLVRKFDRPAIVLAVKKETSEVKGSARSIPAFDLFNNCMKIRNLFTHFGGHSQAAGMTFPLENVNVIQEKLNEIINEQLTEDDFKQVIEINDSISVTDINEKLVNDINKLAPFGMKNPKPIFQIKDIPASARQIGSNQNHLKLQFRQDNVSLEGIGFGMGELYTYISPETPISVAGELGINEWNGNRKAQIIMQDMKIDEWQLFDHRGKKNLDISPFINPEKRNVVLSNDGIEMTAIAEQIVYNTDRSTLSEIDVLYIFDLPADLTHLKEIIQVTKPVNIYACYYVENSLYLTAFPSREEFKWFYSLLLKQRVLDLKTEMTNIMQARGWDKDRIIFISKVFFELGFVKIENGVIHLVPKPLKKDLQESSLYQERIMKAENEKILYYSTYAELKKWFTNQMNYLAVKQV
ncbi:single-stranded-DNA-specific exonuclease RecJ [Virgibacillus profundi]|uniref:Single-stranded-DNA-specific exonuclease RecJ n=1 Tax=Virgibacillus profundi TaxID=2024555 RepID=A0A2A2IB38_9BACI|nr:single-stranded-DNA-specific exonuclease RecJ [Virgibacillus profundi]PAV28939.1 single-stranded-DNA-specific exonuclease RecJ [Virgibacillus profundi]PXY53107.1 single-stranded-DNA-specific exonuclease RecJ [Virgibacillus profundi]